MSATTRLLACFVALMMAMGIGRFALTPQLPHLIGEGQLSLTAAGLVAAANYLGYLIGAVDAMFTRSQAQVRLRLSAGLWLCVLLTLASYWAHDFRAHLLLRFGTGVASAWALVMITTLSQQLATHSNRQRLGALVFAGPGLGIFVTGLLALFSNLQGLGSAALWLIYAATALVMLLAVRRALPTPQLRNENAVTTASPGIGRLGLIYLLYGVGYIIPATFMSQMASARFHGHWLADLFWPCFGLGAAVGVVLVSLRRVTPGSTQRWLLASLWLQAGGVFACLLGNGPGLALGVMFCGVPFLACMLLVMQRLRELTPNYGQRDAGLLTACFAVGQLCGPLLAALSTRFSGSLQAALVFAGCGLLLAGVLAVLRPASGRARPAGVDAPTVLH